MSELESSKKVAEVGAPENSAPSEFLIAEYQALRSEVEFQITERRKIESQTAIGMAAIYAWLLTQDSGTNSTLLQAGFVLPIAVAFLGCVRWAALMSGVIALGEYIQKIEGVLAKEPSGWEHFLSQRRKEKKIVGQSEGWSGIAFWFILLVGSAAALFWIHTTGGLVRHPDTSIWSQLFGGR